MNAPSDLNELGKDAVLFSNSFVTLIDKNTLRIDPAYQRKTDIKRAKKIAKNFNPALFGALLISLRGGLYWIVDGGHRYAAVMLLDHITMIPCAITEHDTLEDEAGKFVIGNTNRKPLGPLELFKANIAAGDPLSLAIAQMTRRIGFSIGVRSDLPSEISAVTLLMQLGKQNLIALDAALRVGFLITQASNKPLIGGYLGGLWYLEHKFIKYHHRIDALRVAGVDEYNKIYGTLRSVYGKVGGHSYKKVSAECLVAIMNRKCRKRILLDGTTAKEDDEAE